MTSLKKEHFETFHQPYFSFKQLKEKKTPAEIDELKGLYKKTWEVFKNWQLEAATKIPFPLKKIRVESWTNGWNLRNHFWCPYRLDNVSQAAPCLACMLDGEKLTIYLMYQHYKSNPSIVSPTTYNQVLEKIPTWYEKTSHPFPLYFWQYPEEKIADFTLIQQTSDFTTNPLKSLDTTFCIGYVLQQEEHDIEEKIAAALLNLWPLYQETVKNLDL